MWYVRCLRWCTFQQPGFHPLIAANIWRGNSNVTAIKDNQGGDSDFEVIRKHLWQFSGGVVTLSKDETTGVAMMLLNRPEKRNALSGQMMVQFRDHVEELERWNTGKGLIVYGEGNFCAGGDLDFVRLTGTAEGVSYMSRWMMDAMTRLQKLPLVSVCLLTGSCLGGGAELSVFSDYIIAGDDLRYGFIHGRMGIISAFGGGTRLARRIGYHKALYLLLTAKVLKADELVQLGLAECVVPASEALGEAKGWLNERLQHHHDVVRAMKDTMYKASVSSYTDSLSYEGDRFPPFWGGDLNKEALLKNIKHVQKVNVN